MKALVVDDVAYSRIIARKVLEGLGFVVVEASSGEIALQALREEPEIALVLSDLSMPGMDGVELANRAKSIGPAPKDGAKTSRPFILLTATPKPNLLRRAKQSGFVDIMVKPLDPKRLRQTISKHVPIQTKEAYDYGGPLQELRKAIAEALRTEDHQAAQMILDGLEKGMDKISAFLKNAEERKDEVAEDSDAQAGETAEE